MKKLFLVVGILVSTSAFALKEHYGISRSVRALGMGGAFYGLSDDEYALFYNPAGLSLYRGNWQFMLPIPGINSKAEISSGVLDAIDVITSGGDKDAGKIAAELEKFQGKALYAGIMPMFPYFLKKNFAMGLLVADTKLDFALLGKGIDTAVDITGISDSGLFAGYATDFMNETLHIGVNVKAMARAGGKKTFTAADIAQGDDFDLDPKTLGGMGGGIDFDIGAIYELPDEIIPYDVLSRASITFSNLLASSMTIGRQGNDPPGLTRTMSLGWHTVFPGFSSIVQNVNFLFDIAEIPLGGENDADYGAPQGNFFKHVKFGAEAPILGGWLTPRLGFHQGYLSAGFGVNFAAGRFDFATYETELGSAPGRLGSRRYAFRLQIGIGSAPPPPVSYSARNKPADAGKPAATPPPPAQQPAPSPSPSPVPSPSASPEVSPAPSLSPSPSPTPGSDKQGLNEDKLKRKRQAEKLPRIEGNKKDRFGVGNGGDGFDSAPATADTTVPRARGNVKDRFGIDGE